VVDVAYKRLVPQNDRHPKAVGTPIARLKESVHSVGHPRDIIKMAMVDLPPNHTLYVNNLNEKVKRAELLKSLYAAFSQFGAILEIVAHKNYKTRGQAFICFKDIQSATTAMRSMQSFPFYDKQMRIQFAKTKSDALAKLDGTYVERSKRVAREEDDDDSNDNKKMRVDDGAVEEVLAPQQPAVVEMEEAEPHSILFLTGLPQGVTQDMLKPLFGQFPGLKDIRMVPSRLDIAFIEYDDVSQATIAKNELSNFQITPTYQLQVNFAKK